MKELFRTLKNVELNEVLKLIYFSSEEFRISPENKRKLANLKKFLDLLDQGGHLR